MASPVAVALGDNIDSSQDLPPPSFLASRPTARLKSRQAPKSEVQSTTYKKMHTPIKRLEFSNLYRQKAGEHTWEWILRTWDNGGRNIELGRAEFIDVGPLSRDSAFKVPAWRVGSGPNCLGGWNMDQKMAQWECSGNAQPPLV